MPAWGETDILGASGKQQAQAQSDSSTASLLALLASQNSSAAAATAQSSGSGSTPPPGGTPPPKQATTQSSTSNSGPPVPGDHWQGGAPDPRGTQDPQTGKQLGGRYVDPTYQTDANGRQLSPEEQAYWREYDRRRAEAASIARSNNVGGGTSSNVTGNAVYDPITATWSLVDNKGNWTHGVKTADLQSQLGDNLKKQYPDWWWGNYAKQQDLQRRYEVDAGAFDAEKFAGMGSTTTRYGNTNF